MSDDNYEDRYVGTISKHEIVVDRTDYEDESQKARAWGALYSFLQMAVDVAPLTKVRTPDLLKKMDELLKEEVDEDCEESEYDDE
tara:strand:- start:132 stop:386 length:255 start_codon:yes stop_codon:yes gene_type:complete